MKKNDMIRLFVQLETNLPSAFHVFETLKDYDKKYHVPLILGIRSQFFWDSIDSKVYNSIGLNVFLWSINKNVFEIERGFRDTIRLNSIEKLKCKLIEQMPDLAVFVRCENETIRFIEGKKKLFGIVYVLKTNTKNDEILSMTFIYGKEKEATKTFTVELILNQFQTLGELVENYLIEEDLKEKVPKDNLIAALNYLLYISSTKADITGNNEWEIEKRSFIPKLTSWSLRIAKQPTLWSVGSHLGPLIKNEVAMKSVDRLTKEEKKTLKNGYWQENKDSYKNPIVRWLHPVITAS